VAFVFFRSSNHKLGFPIGLNFSTADDGFRKLLLLGSGTSNLTSSSSCRAMASAWCRSSCSWRPPTTEARMTDIPLIPIELRTESVMKVDDFAVYETIQKLRR